MNKLIKELLKQLGVYKPIKSKLTWPLGINPEMDKHAQNCGIINWCCVSPTSNEFWVRRDGMNYTPTFDFEGGYITELKVFDRKYPMRKDWTEFKELIEKK